MQRPNKQHATHKHTREKATQITNIEITTAMPLFKSSKQKRKDAAAKKVTENAA